VPPCDSETGAGIRFGLSPKNIHLCSKLGPTSLAVIDLHVRDGGSVPMGQLPACIPAELGVVTSFRCKCAAAYGAAARRWFNASRRSPPPKVATIAAPSVVAPHLRRAAVLAWVPKSRHRVPVTVEGKRWSATALHRFPAPCRTTGRPLPNPARSNIGRGPPGLGVPDLRR